MAVTPAPVYNTSLKVGAASANHVLALVTNLRVQDKYNLVDITSQGDAYVRRFPTIEDWSINADLVLGLIDPSGIAFTNDLSAGNDVEINVAATAGFLVGDIIQVTSSTGSEDATVTVVHTDSHITVNTLGLDHSTSGRLLYRNLSQTEVHTAWRAGAVIYVDILMDAATHHYSGTGYVESFDKTFDPAGVIKASIVIQPASVLTYA